LWWFARRKTQIPGKASFHGIIKKNPFLHSRPNRHINSSYKESNIFAFRFRGHDRELIEILDLRGDLIVGQTLKNEIFELFLRLSRNSEAQKQGQGHEKAFHAFISFGQLSNSIEQVLCIFRKNYLVMNTGRIIP